MSQEYASLAPHHGHRCAWITAASVVVMILAALTVVLRS